MEPVELMKAYTKAYQFIATVPIEDIFKPVAHDMRKYIETAWRTILNGGAPAGFSTLFPKAEALLNMYGATSLLVHAPDLSPLGLKWYIEDGDLVIGLNGGML